MFNLLAAPFTTPTPNIQIEEPVPSIDRTVGATLDVIQWIGYLLSAGLFILAIIFLVKSIIDRKKVSEEISEKTLGSVKTTSIILLIINILAVCSNFVMAIIAIISTVFAAKAKKLFLTDIEAATAKAKTASLLNIIVAALMLLGPIITVFGVTLLNVVWNAMPSM